MTAKKPDSDTIHLACLTEAIALCGSTDGSWEAGTFVLSERRATCEDCLQLQDSADSPLFQDEWGEW